MKFVNLGCGNRYSENWLNIDFVSADRSVTAHNLREGIPLPDDSVDLVYCSHLLEHFSKTEAPSFVAECLRVLRSGGVLRVVVPDLEGIAREYLKSLEEARDGIAGADKRHEWMAIELLDQMVRESSGGEMLKYLSQPNIPVKEFILKRLGVEAKKIIDRVQIIRPREQCEKQKTYGYFGKGRAAWFRKRSQNPELEVAAFRRSGEVHRWMYDSFSLKKLLDGAGAQDIVQRTAFDSYIPEWASYNLDTEPDGSVYKPDSIFMEGRKP